ncbi:MAG: RHS repeat-associated core domain-containing protein, partial [Planctomycetaceae bacterium]|nr:RHS repeat-associated core domain-containing protein [Planctomycetaceae bacterium]
QFDSKIGQQYLRARYYDPVTGRFNRLDPFFGNINEPLSLHKYLYTHTDPVNGIDPSGNVTTGTGQRVHAVISALYAAHHFGNDVRLGLGLPGFARVIMPDILDRTLAEIGDIKPLSQYGFRTGEVQVNVAVALANGVKTTYHGTVYTPSVALTHYNTQRQLWIPMTWNPEGMVVPISSTEAAMIIGTLNGVLYYLTIPKIKQPLPSLVVVPESAPVSVPVHTTDSVFKTIAQDILRDIQSGLAADPIQQLIYSIKIEHAAAAVGLVTLGLGGATLVSNANRLRLSMANVITVPVCAVMCVGF